MLSNRSLSRETTSVHRTEASPARRGEATQRGALAVYMALVIAFTITSSVIVLSSILARQVQEAHAVVASERAFYAANTGFEEALAVLSRTEELTYETEAQLQYEDGTIDTFTVRAEALESGGQRVPCVLSIGRSGNEERRIFTGPAECTLMAS